LLMMLTTFEEWVLTFAFSKADWEESS
jgi:hypothetical protein